MTLESEIIEIFRTNNLRHLSAVVTSDGLIKVSIQERKPPRVKGFDPAAYYRNNKEKIKKYQHEYYLRKRGKNQKTSIVSGGTYVPTPEDLAKAMASLYSKDGTALKADELRDTALHVMQFFGFEREVVGNHLEPDEISLMYQLEDIGLISTRIEEHNLLDGKPWRVNYFILNVGKIREYSSKTIEGNSADACQVYENLPEEMWAR
jgi:hypothetical protein